MGVLVLLLVWLVVAAVVVAVLVQAVQAVAGPLLDVASRVL